MRYDLLCRDGQRKRIHCAFQYTHFFQKNMLSENLLACCTSYQLVQKTIYVVLLSSVTCAASKANNANF